MPGTRERLQRRLASQYRQLRQRLSRKLGSEALADEALHETWIRLDKARELPPVVNEDAYLLRAAANMATNLRISEQRHARSLELDQALEEADEAPDAMRVAAGKAQIAAVMRALDELPARQRDVFTAWFHQDTTTEELAARHEVSLRTIQTDLRSAVMHCARRTGRKDLFANRSFKLSRD